MSNLFSINWWVSMLISTMVTIFFIWLIKKVSSKANIPVVSDIISEA